jgi:NAD(P)H-hydrate epimerase
MAERFRTPDGRSVPAVTADEMRAVDRAAEDAGLGVLRMMEHAGRGLAATAREQLDDVADGEGPVLVLAGGGGNGGGGLCAVRHLRNHGVDARAALDRDPADLDGPASAQWRVLDATNVTPVVDAADAVASAAVVVDALVGYGLRDAPRGRAADLVGACDDADRVLALDVPSGVNATTGERPGVAVAADRTLTLALPKTGLVDAGDVLLADIGIPGAVVERAGVAYESPWRGEYRVRLEPASA